LDTAFEVGATVSAAITEVRLYVYLGDRMSDPALRGRHCTAVLTGRGKCICGRGAMLVLFVRETTPRVVLRRMLRKVPSV
jgi:hypothetical protein